MCINRRNSGLTLIEVMATVAIISVLAAGVLPLSQMMYKRTKELELRNNLRIIRTALDKHEELVDQGVVPKNTNSGYPESLEVLVNGVDLKEAVDEKKKFLRRIPKDPMTENGEWGLRAYADNSDSTIWGGQDVYDVYSLSDRQAIDGTYYKEW
ncbi:MAG: type II secretion system protein [Desulfobacteraceae bacterium]|nr:type II secretion system protein [Desulfobacteraceae bacterium]